MGIDDCIAADPDDYVRLALKMGTDRQHRETLSARVMAASDTLFEDMEADHEHERIIMERIENHDPGR